jgi:hypothetical protein
MHILSYFPNNAMVAVLARASRGKAGTGFPQIAMRPQKLGASCPIHMSGSLL